MSNAATTVTHEAPELTLGEWLQKARRDARMDQSVLASYVGVSQRTISNWERNQGCPDVRQYRRIADGTGARWLLDLTHQNWKTLTVIDGPTQPELPLDTVEPVLELVRC